LGLDIGVHFTGRNTGLDVSFAALILSTIWWIVEVSGYRVLALRESSAVFSGIRDILCGAPGSFNENNLVTFFRRKG
jgi:hypothetical protein